MKRIIFALTLILTISLSNYYRPEMAQAAPPSNDLIVHEWGTFTSIAGRNGAAVDWRPLNGASDLPTFVYREDETNGFRNTHETRLKGKTRTLAKVRMETPVIYFYTENEMEIDVSVGFPNGKITEWYPQANIVNADAGNNQKASFGNGINWGMIKLLPDEKPDYLREAADSHYYPARETDAAPLQICNADKTKIEKEKFLFYRGIGDFGLPLNVKIAGKNLILKDDGSEEIKNLIIFENSGGGRIGFKLIDKLSRETITARPETNKNLDQVLLELEKILISEGLYAKEAKAMIETWRDSWFEEGLRIFYVLTRKSTDKILPLNIEPQPKEIVRVMIGRAEVITPEMEQAVRKQVGFLRSNSAKIREQAQANLKKYGRFYEPILKNILESETNTKVRRQIQKLLEIS